MVIAVHKSVAGSKLCSRISRLDGDFYTLDPEHVSFSPEIETILSCLDKKKKIVPIQISNPLLLLVACIRCWEHGLTPLLLNPKFPYSETLTRYHRQIRVRLIDDRKKVGSDLLRLRLADLRSIPAGSTVSVLRKKNPQTPIILLTSGTTGEPMAVKLQFENLISAFRSGEELFGYQVGESWLLSLPLYHIGGFSIFFRAWLADQLLIIPESLDSESLSSVLRTLPVHYLSLVPTQLHRMKGSVRLLRKVKAILLGGAPMPPEELSWYLGKGLQIYNVYGSSETSAFCVAATPADLAGYPGCAGRPMPGVELRVLDDALNQVPSDQIGRLAVRGGSVIRHYYLGGRKAQSRFSDGFFISGDVGYQNAEGILFVSGRYDDMINSGGEKINPREIEDVIRRLNGVRDCVVFGLPDPEWGQAVAVLIVPLGKQTASAVRRYLPAELPSFKRPKYYFTASEIPAAGIGKTNRKEIGRMAQHGYFAALT